MYSEVGNRTLYRVAVHDCGGPTETHILNETVPEWVREVLILKKTSKFIKISFYLLPLTEVSTKTPKRWVKLKNNQKFWFCFLLRAFFFLCTYDTFLSLQRKTCRQWLRASTKNNRTRIRKTYWGWMREYRVPLYRIKFRKNEHFLAWNANLVVRFNRYSVQWPGWWHLLAG